MPTEYKPGNVAQPSSDSIVDVLSNSNLPVLHPGFPQKNRIVTPPKPTETEQSQSNNKPKPQKQSFFAFVGSILTSDVLWFSVSIACLLATILFYFQVLQPLVLQKYIDGAQAQIIEGNQKFNNQITEFGTLQQSITSNLRTTTNDPCTEEAKYTQSDQDQKSMESLKNTLVIDKKLNNLPNFYVFSDKETVSIYNRFLADSKKALSDLTPVVDQTKQAIELGDYKNSWIDSCISIKDSKGETKELQAVCQNISNKAAYYNKIGAKSIVDQLAKPIEETNNLCKDVQASKALYYPQYGNFQLKWLSQFDIVNGLTLNPNQSSLDSITLNFQNSVLSRQQALNSIFEDRTTFSNMWYILDLNY
jgi:hypothetical protein